MIKCGLESYACTFHNLKSEIPYIYVRNGVRVQILLLCEIWLDYSTDVSTILSPLVQN